MNEEFKVGDKVTFTKTAMRGRRVSMTTVSGVIEIIELSMARVKSRATHHDIPLSRLSHVGQQSELTTAFLKLGEKL